MKIPQELSDTVVDPTAYSDGHRIDDAFTWMRRESPLAILEPRGYAPFWAVTRHADILTVERQNDLFRSGDRPTIVTSEEGEAKIRQMTGGSPHLVRTLVQMDNPDHFAYRHLTQAWFMPQRLKELEPRIRVIARRFVDRMASHGDRCDFARDVAFLYPLHVIMEVLGVPEIDEPRMLHLTQELFGSADPDLNRSGNSNRTAAESLTDIKATITDFMTYFTEMTEERRRNPRNDLASVIANGTIDGKPLGHLEAMSYYIISATAGHDTTSNTLAGAMWALAENPTQFAKLKANSALINAHVEESIRWVTPVKHFMRTAADDVELSGKLIPKGDWLMLCYASGNRDEDIYSDPFKYNIERPHSRHVAFGYGAHICLGQHLARMEMRILWDELIPRLEYVALDGEPTRTKGKFVCGPKTVPVSFKMS